MNSAGAEKRASATAGPFPTPEIELSGLIIPDVTKATTAAANALKASEAAKTLAQKAGQNADEAERLLKQINSDIGGS